MRTLTVRKPTEDATSVSHLTYTSTKLIYPAYLKKLAASAMMIRFSFACKLRAASLLLQSPDSPVSSLTEIFKKEASSTISPQRTLFCMSDCPSDSQSK